MANQTSLYCDSCNGLGICGDEYRSNDTYECTDCRGSGIAEERCEACGRKEPVDGEEANGCICCRAFVCGGCARRGEPCPCFTEEGCDCGTLFKQAPGYHGPARNYDRKSTFARLVLGAVRS